MSYDNEEDEARSCLQALRDGSPSEKIAARESLARIFTRRGMDEEATELYEANVRAGVRSPELFERLGESYHRIGEHEAAEASLAEAQRLRATPPRTSPPPRIATPPAHTQPRPASTPPAIAGGQPARSGAPPAPAASAPPSSDFGLTSGQRLTPAAAPTAQTGATGSTGRVVQFPGPTARLGAQSAAPAETERLPAAYRYDPDEADLLNEPAVPAPRPRRKGVALPGPLLALLGLVFLVIVPVALLALLVVNPVALYLEGRPAGPTIEVAATTPAQLKVASGAATNWYVHTGRSVSGLWASPGLDLTLDRELEGAGGTFPVTAARPQSWGETITIVERRGQGRANQETVLPATLLAPASLPPAGTVIDGKIVGQVTAPRLSETSQFNTTADTVSVPVQLVVVSAPELWLDRFLNSLRMYFDEDRWLLVTIGALLTWCVLAGGAAILFRVRQG